MRLADGIREHGYMKWYERELTRGHVRLIVLILCTLALLAIVELIGRRPPPLEQAANVIALVVVGWIGVQSLRRYLYFLMHAESVASQAVCPRCKAYGRLELVGDDPKQDRVAVACRSCRHEWQIEDVSDR